MSLNSEQKHAIELALRQRRAAVLEELRSETHAEDGTMRLPTHGGEADDDVTSATDAVDMAQTLRDASELERIDAALARLPSAQFGVCVDCREDIGVDRLQAEPTAVRCTPCQTRYEKSHASV
ncbi:MAG: TraR/DksA family transcriptional regulator [Proteobacteria bacterium]|nr:TraR/DksA family transcriptional regulator [Pseudomonadota bacterium]